MRQDVRERLKKISELYPPERLRASRERIRRLWRGEQALDRRPFVLIPPSFSYYDDVFEPEQGLIAYLDDFIAHGLADDDYIPGFFTGCRMGALPSLFGAREVIAGGDYCSERIIRDAQDVFTLPEPGIRPGSAAAKWLEAQRFYLEQTEGEIAVHANDMQGMLDVCGQLWGYDNVLAAPYEDEEAYRCLMDKVTRAFIYLWREQERTLGKCFMPTHLYAWDSVPPQNGATLSADALVMLSPDFFVKWYQPYLERVSDELGGLTVHSCGNFSQVAAPLCGVRGLRGINASQMDVGQLLSAGADREKVFIFLCPFGQAEALARRARADNLRVSPTITQCWPEDFATTGRSLLKRRVDQLKAWFSV